MTQPDQPLLPVVLLTAFPLMLEWKAVQDRCWQHPIGGGNVLLAAVSAEELPLRYASLEVPVNTISGSRGRAVRGMIFRDLMRQLDTGVSL